MPELGLRVTAQGRLSISDQFADKLTSDYPTVRQAMIDDGGWLPAVRTKVDHILGMSQDTFASVLEPAAAD